MTQKYDKMNVLCPGTVIITAAGNCSDITNIISPALKEKEEIYIILICLMITFI